MFRRGWSDVALGAVCTPGGLVRGPFGGSLKKEHFVPVGYQVYEQRHAIASSVQPARYFIDEKKFEEMKRFAVRPGDFIVSCSGTIGRIFRIPDGAPAGIINQALLKITLDTSMIDPGYFEQYFRWNVFQDQILESTQGGAMHNLVGMPIIRRTPIALPASLDSQRAIGQALSEADAMIDALGQLLVKAQAIKQGMMQELLAGHTRLSGFSGSWTDVVAGDIGVFRGGSGFPVRFQGATAGVLPFFKVSDMNSKGNELFMRRANNYVSELQRKQMGAVVMPAQAIVFAKVGAAVFVERKRVLALPSCIDNNMAAFILDSSRADTRFIHYVLSNFRMGSLVATGALPSLNGRQLRAIPIALPPQLGEQRAIASTLSSVDSEIELLRRRLAKARDVKAGMMQQLLTGQSGFPMGEATS